MYGQSRQERVAANPPINERKNEMSNGTTDGKTTAQLYLFENITRNDTNNDMAISEKTTEETASPMKDSGIEWIGEIPTHWEIVRLKYLANDEPHSFDDGDWIETPVIQDHGIRYYTTGNVGDGKFKFQGDGFISEETFKKLNCKYAYPGDLVISRLNAPYGRSCIIPNEYDKCIVAVDVVIFRTNEDKRYLCYVTQCPGYHRAVEDKAAGTTMKRISRSKLGTIMIPHPPLSEQIAIASHLDSITSRIDEAVRLIDEQLADLKDYRKALISEVVTRGVPSDSTPQPTKPTNTKWIPEIPTHWKTRKFRYLLESMESGGTPSSSYSHYYEGDIPFVAIGDMSTTRIIRETARHISKEAQYSKNLKQYPSGTTLYSIYATIGAVSQLGISACINQALLALTPKPRLLNNYFMQYVLMAIQSYAISIASSNTQKNLNAETVSNFRIPLPPLDEQETIVNYLDQRLSALSRHEEMLFQQRDDLLAYRQSVISEYVTGKRRV